MPASPTTGQIAPWRFLMFFGLLVLGFALALQRFEWAMALLIGFDVAALMFLLSCASIFNDDVERLRASAARNDANRVTLLGLTFLLTLIVFAAILVELSQRDTLAAAEKWLIAASLALVWTFGNMVYAMHYTHLFYTESKAGKDAAGLEFPGTRAPLFSDFTYFAFTLGVAVQTSDVQITAPHIRKVVTFHCVAGFFFNLGVLALSLNVLGSN